MTRAIEAGEFIEAGQYHNHLYGTSIAAVRHVAVEGLTCVLDVSISAIAKLHECNLHPIIIYLKPSSLSTLREQNSHFSEQTGREVFNLSDRVEKEYRHLFTQLVLNYDLNVTYTRVLETLRRQSREPYWGAISQFVP